MRIAVCDDNALFLKEIQAQLQALPMAGSVSPFSDLDTFLFAIDEGKRYDAVLMDIEWNQSDRGMDVAEELYGLCPETRIIYVTGYNDRFSQRIFLHRANLSGYLTKPVDTELLRANLEKAASAPPREEAPSIVLRRRGAPVSVPLREILFIESRGHTVEVHTDDEAIVVYEGLKNLLHALTDAFFQCHKSFIVNMDRIRRFSSGDILLKNGERVQVSRARYAKTKEAYFRHMGRKL